MTAPVRLQLSRRKGFSLQAWSREVNGLDAVNVSRLSLWGNPFVIGKPSGYLFEDGGDQTPMISSLSVDQAILFYREAFYCISPEMHPWGHRWAERWRKSTKGRPGEFLAELRGRNLACFCRSDQPCHADVLLEIANR